MLSNAQIKLAGAEQLDRALQNALKPLRDLRPIWAALAEEVYRAERELFESEGGKIGGWAPLAPATARGKALNYPGRALLRASGALFRSVTNPKAANAIFRATETELLIGSRLERAQYHQRGTARMPVRRVLAITDADEKRMQARAESFYGKQLEQAGFALNYGGRI